MTYSVVGCSDKIDKNSSSLLFSRKTILNLLCLQGDLVYGRPPVPKARLLLWEQVMLFLASSKRTVVRTGMSCQTLRESEHLGCAAGELYQE